MGPDANPIICVATNAQLLILSLPAGSTDAPEVPNEMHLDAWYSQHFRHPPGERLYYYPNYSTPLWGDASGAVSISRVFTRAGVDAQILPEHVLDTFVLRDRNVFLLGRPQDSAAAALFLNGLFYNIKWFSDVKDLEIYFTEPQMNVPRRLEHKTDSVHGLITVISSTNHEGSPTRMVILSGINTAGTLGAAEFFSSPDQMQEFKTRLIHDGYKAFPKVYQIVISTESNQTLPFKSSMESYKVITQ